MPQVTMSLNSGVIGLPPDTKESGTRVDFATNDFDIVIETKGYRLAWSRASLCPCVPVNTQTKQPDPTCTQCKGRGWFYFAPSLATARESVVGELTGVQSRIVADAAAVIMGIMTGLTAKDEVYGEIGKRLSGATQVTVRAANKLGYHDRIVNLDVIIVYAQLIELETVGTTELRYPGVAINDIRTVDKTFTAPDDFDLVDGDIVWNLSSGNLPAVDDLLSVNYLCHPTWLVVEHPHATRQTFTKHKVSDPLTPAGNPIDMPVQALIQYEFMPEIT